MILKNKMLLYAALFLCLPSAVSANITTLQYWDPVPFFNASNLNMAPSTQFCYRLKKRFAEEESDKLRRFGINISPFVQKATRAQQDAPTLPDGSAYFGQTGTSTIAPGKQMGDYQGTLYLMGLFLGQDVNGNSIWGGPADLDTGSVTNITAATVSATFFEMPNLQNAVNALNDNADETFSGGVITAAGPNAIIYGQATNPLATIPNTIPSILSASVLEQDQVYFGAVSVPLTYQKAGFRWEANFDISNSVGFLARGGFCQITQRTGNPISLSSQLNQPDGTPSIYSLLNNVSNGTNLPTSGTGTSLSSGPNTLAQTTYYEWVDNNINDLLDPTNGANYDLTTFSETGIEDIQLLAFIRHPFVLHPANTLKHTSMILTPYAMIGWTLPIGTPVIDYSKLYALPFGNNGHTAVGGVLGLTMDFANKIEFGFEFGATGFLKKLINQLPCPNHMLQRVVYPYRQDVYYSPGFNGQFAAIFNAYEFTQNTSFSLRYNYVQHSQDTITLVTESPYFFPDMLEKLSTWSSQMFIAGLTFELQPSIYLSLAWQGALSQKNAYCSNTILGSLNFQF